jgi:hypothetical protein
MVILIRWEYEYQWECHPRRKTTSKMAFRFFRKYGIIWADNGLVNEQSETGVNAFC